MGNLLPLREAAGEFGVDRTTLHRHVRAGRLRAFRRPMDRRTYVDREELRALLMFRPVGSRPSAEHEEGDLRRVADALDRFASVRRERRRQGRDQLDAERLARGARRELDGRTVR